MILSCGFFLQPTIEKNHALTGTEKFLNRLVFSGTGSGTFRLEKERTDHQIVIRPVLPMSLFHNSGFFWVVLLVAVVPGCSRSPTKVSAKKHLEKRIEFDFYYRKDTSSPHSVTRKLGFLVPVLEGDVIENALIKKPRRIEVGEFVVSIQTDFNCFFLDVFEKADPERLRARKLFQIDKGLKNLFAGEHGFTGLNYFYHSKTDGELQFIGKVKGSD